MCTFELDGGLKVVRLKGSMVHFKSFKVATLAAVRLWGIGDAQEHPQSVARLILGSAFLAALVALYYVVVPPGDRECDSAVAFAVPCTMVVRAPVVRGIATVSVAPAYSGIAPDRLQ